MAIANWPRELRPRERLAAHGPQALTDPELLALFLRTGVPGKSAIELGCELIAHFGSIANVFTATGGDFANIKGVGPAKQAALRAVLELARRIQREELDGGPVFESPAAVSNYLHLHFAGRRAECFVVMFLDVQHRLLACDTMFEGTLTRTSVYPREIVRRALAHNAAAAIFAHNHPSGRPEPSPLDRELTLALEKALKLVEVSLLDHMIVAGGKTWSFRAHGELAALSA